MKKEISKSNNKMKLEVNAIYGKLAQGMIDISSAYPKSGKDIPIIGWDSEFRNKENPTK